MTREIARQGLNSADRELFDLRYLDPTDEDTFARVAELAATAAAEADSFQTIRSTRGPPHDGA